MLTARLINGHICFAIAENFPESEFVCHFFNAIVHVTHSQPIDRLACVHLNTPAILAPLILV